MSHYFLVHGSSVGGWCWTKVKQILEEEGHSVYAPDLPGHDFKKEISPGKIALETYVSFVCDAIRDTNDKVIVVGHSMGGAIVTNAAEYVYEKIKKIVYICAIVPQNGDSIGGLLKQDTHFSKSIISINKSEMYTELDIDKIDTILFNGCSKEDIEYAKKHLIKQPLIPFLDKIELPEENFKKVERIGVVCREDRSLSPSFQEKMYDNAECKKVYCNCGHSPYFSHPEELGRILICGC